VAIVMNFIVFLRCFIGLASEFASPGGK
jgi:hypothetical protein